MKARLSRSEGKAKKNKTKRESQNPKEPRLLIKLIKLTTWMATTRLMVKTVHCITCSETEFESTEIITEEIPGSSSSDSSEFVETEVEVCKPCEGRCYSCTSADDCLSCVNADHFLHLERCIDECSSGYYNSTDGDIRTCSPCHSSCLECYADGPNACVDCHAKKLRKDGSCKNNCPDSEFANDGSGQRCQGCHFACKTCFDGTKYGCIKCHEANPYKLPDKSCNSGCKEQQYLSSPDRKVCSSCHEDCLSCNGGFKTSCLECKDGKLVGVDGICSSTCMEGSFQANETHCGICAPLCSECTGPTVRECLKCDAGYLYHEDSVFDPSSIQLDPWQNPATAVFLGQSLRINRQGECLNICQRGFYRLTNEDGIEECHRCHGSCSTCFGPEATDCISCTRNMTFISSSSTCECFQGFFDFGNIKDERAGYCESCYFGCLRCYSPEKQACFRCSPGYFLQSGTCVLECGEGFYKEGTLIDNYQLTGNERCLPCHQSCKNCLGPEEGDCFECKQPYIKVHEDEHANRGRCLNCFQEFEIEQAWVLCRGMNEFGIKKAERPRDGYSSRSVYLTYKDDYYFRDRFYQINDQLNDYFEVRIPP